ncbi:MAG: FliG C-terminal domain-containing protein [Fuerstiella sp.]
MNGHEQSLAFLRLLSADAAEEVLSRMRPETAEMLRTKLTGSGRTKIKAGQQKRVMEQFDTLFNLLGQAEISNKPALDAVVEPISEPKKPKLTVTTGDPIKDLESLSRYQIANALKPEQARTAAILLNQMSSTLAADVLALLPDEQQSLVIKELSTEQHAPPILVERIVRATLNRGRNMPSEPPDDRDQIERLAEMLREVPKATRSKMIKAIADEDPELKDRLLAKLYVFTDLATLEQHMVQKVMAQVDTTTLVTALFQADQSLLDAVFGAVSSRAKMALQEEMQFQTHVPEQRVTDAREMIVRVLGVVCEGGD